MFRAFLALLVALVIGCGLVACANQAFAADSVDEQHLADLSAGRARLVTEIAVKQALIDQIGAELDASPTPPPATASTMMPTWRLYTIYTIMAPSGDEVLETTMTAGLSQISACLKDETYIRTSEMVTVEIQYRQGTFGGFEIFITGTGDEVYDPARHCVGGVLRELPYPQHKELRIASLTVW